MKNHNFHSSGLKEKIDQIVNILYSGGLNNIMDVIEQISYLLFLKILTEKENSLSKISKKHKSIFKDNFTACSWDYLIPLGGQELIKSMRNAIEKIQELPYMSQAGKLLFNKATLKIMDSATLKAVLGVIESMSFELISESDIKGDAYEHLLKKLSASGTNGQFRTPKHIIEMIVKLVDPKIGDTICDPACGTGGFLIASYRHILEANTSLESIKSGNGVLGDNLKPKQWDFLENQTFTGLDNDSNMVKIACLNLYLRNLPKAKINYHNTLTQTLLGGYSQWKFDVILANPPFSGNVQQDSIQEDLNTGFQTRATELLFLKWIIDHLKDGARAGVIVPNGVLFGSTKAHMQIRQILLKKCDLQGVITMPSGIFKPYSGVATSILIFEKGKPTEKVWFYEMTADGFSLDDKRSVSGQDDIPDILKNWKRKSNGEKCFWINVKDIEKTDFNLSLNLYRKENVSNDTEILSPQSIVNEIMTIQGEISSKLSVIQRAIRS